MSPALNHTVLRVAAFAAALAAFALVSAPADRSAARGSSCDAAGKRSDRVARSGARAAVRCLINKARAGRSLKLRRNLNRAAQKHSNYMNRSRCFAHQCPGEPSLEKRVRSTGYLSGVSSYRIGEVIALNRDRATPRQIVRQWKNSSVHRGQILSRGYRHMGVGIVVRRGRAFYTVTLGARRR